MSFNRTKDGLGSDSMVNKSGHEDFLVGLTEDYGRNLEERVCHRFPRKTSLLHE